MPAADEGISASTLSVLITIGEFERGPAGQAHARNQAVYGVGTCAVNVTSP
jgi:hypothetical protein